MIVDSMSYLEAFNQIESDLSKVEIWAEKFLPKVAKEFGKTGAFPKYHIEKYIQLKTKNEYRIFYYAGNAREKVIYKLFYVTYYENHRLVIRTERCEYQHTEKSPKVVLPIIHIYLPHFLERYNERFLHLGDVSDDVIAGHFIARNELFCQIPLNEDINRNYQDYGEYNMYGIRVRDGFCFTKTSIEGKESEDCIDEHDKVEAMRIVYTTYMNESGMSNTQRAAIEKEHFEVLKRYMSEFMGISDTDMSVRGKM